MKTLITKSLILIALMMLSVAALAQHATDSAHVIKGIDATQDTNRTYRVLEYDPHNYKVIPDKVFEFGVPLLILFLVANTILSIFRIKEESRLKEKALEKGISEATLIELFREDKKMMRTVYLKWTLVLAAIGVALLYIHFLDQFLNMSSGYLGLGFIALFLSIAFFIYYRIIRKD